MKSPFKNIGIVTRPNTPEIQDTVHTLVSFLRENGFTIYLDELSVGRTTASISKIPPTAKP